MMNSPARGRRSVLVVEDDAALRADYASKLERLGYRVHCSPSAEAGLRWAREHAVDVVLTDNILPGMTGLRAISEFAKCSTAPVIVMTSAFDRDVEADALLLGARSCLRKPLDPAALSHELEGACRPRGIR